MVRQDLVFGLKNAVDRGFPLERAKQSFVTAGYSIEEVEEAAQFVHSSGPSIIEETSMPVPTRAIQRAVQPAKQKKSFFRNWKLFLLLAVLVLLIFVLVLTFLFREKIIGLFS